MSEVEKTIADIRAMPNNTEAWWVSSLGDNDRFEASKLHALADAYELQLAINTELNAENAELREALVIWTETEVCSPFTVRTKEIVRQILDAVGAEPVEMAIRGKVGTLGVPERFVDRTDLQFAYKEDK